MDERLIAVLSKDAVGSLSDAEWRALLDAADAHRVQALVAKRLLPHAAEGRKPELRAVLEAAAFAGMLRHRDFAAVVRALDGIPVIALKGIHLASVVYGDVAVRPMRDLDLLVRTADLAAAAEALERIGYAPARPYVADGGYAAWHHLPRFAKDGATSVEIHWHITEHRSAIDVDELWERSAPQRIAGVDVRVLGAEDLLLHLAIHATYSHLCELSARAWCDIAETIRHCDISWTDVIERAGRWRCRRGTYLALRVSRDVAGAAVPDEALRALRPDDFDDDLLRIASLAKPADEMRVSTHWLRLRNETTLRGKVRAIARRVFLPRDVIADHYAVPRTSARVFALYALRVRDVLRHRPRARADAVHDRSVIEAFLRHG